MAQPTLARLRLLFSNTLAKSGRWPLMAAHALAIARTRVISLVRIKGTNAIKETTEWFAADRTRALSFMTT